jgi:hypothetical protein
LIFLAATTTVKLHIPTGITTGYLQTIGAKIQNCFVMLTLVSFFAGFYIKKVSAAKSSTLNASARLLKISSCKTLGGNMLLTALRKVLRR